MVGSVGRSIEFISETADSKIEIHDNERLLPATTSDLTSNSDFPNAIAINIE